MPKLIAAFKRSFGFVVIICLAVSNLENGNFANSFAETSTSTKKQSGKTVKPDTSAKGIDTTAQKPSQKSEKFIVYYFMTSYRCPSCHKIENYTHEAVQTDFAKELKSGRMEWKMLNVEEPANEHFVKEYKLYTKSVVLSNVKDGKELQWKNLDKVWQLLNQEQAFKDYIKKELIDFMKNGKS